MDLHASEPFPGPPSEAIGALDSPGPTSSPLVFVNLSTNPAVEAKEARHKNIVSRWAVVNACRYPSRVHVSLAADVSARSSPVDSDDAPNRRKRTGKKSLPRSSRWKNSSVASYLSCSGIRPAVGAASKDPFESLPSKLDNRTWRLLNYWLDARGWGPAREAYRNQVSEIRKQLCFPLIASSSVSLAAAIALVEVTVHPLAPQSATSFHLSRALPELQKTLTRPIASAAPHTALAVVLLMNVAIHIRDFEALRAHFFGLAALLSRHPELHVHNEYTRGLCNAWAFSYARVLDPSQLPEHLVFDASSCSVNVRSSFGASLDKLRLKGLVSDKIFFATQSLAALTPLLECATQGRLSPDHAADLLRCIWASSLQLQRALRQCRTRVEKMCWYATTLHLLTEINHSADNKLVGLCVGLCSQIMRVNLERLLREAPEFVLWTSLMAASRTLDRPSMLWLGHVAKRSFKILNLENFEQASSICETFFWSAHIEKNARLFYHSDNWRDSATDAHGPEMYFQNHRVPSVGTSPGEDFSSPATPCPLCMEHNCPCPMTKGHKGSLVESMKNHLGTVWSMNVADFRKMCDQTWFDDEVDDPPDSNTS